MSIILYINGQQMDLEPGEAIAQTKQVNDLNTLDDRQASYTNKFKIPKTANNLRALKFMSVPGNSSPVPYHKNECSLFSGSGECFVDKGWAVVTDGGDNFEVVVYDGVIDLYKKLENTSLSQLGLEQLGHDKTPEAVYNSWHSDSLPYRYIIADFNGNPGTTPPDAVNPHINIDYMVPSVNVAYLWDLIFKKNGFGYDGSVFKTESFKNLWMTYPKGLSSSDSETNVFVCNSWQWNPDVRYTSFAFKSIEPDTNQLLLQPGTPFLKVSESGYYRFTVSGSMDVTTRVRMYLSKNSESAISTESNAPELSLLAVTKGENLNYTRVLNLDAYDSITLAISHLNFPFKVFDLSNVTVTLTKLEPNKISFGDALSDFSTTDFLKEVVHRFGLTMFKRRGENFYDFLTLQEQLQSAEVVNWSSRFVRKLGEKYSYGSYAQRNWFRYNYHDKESTHNDWYIAVANENLPDTRDVIKSKIYSPEAARINYLGRQTNVYKLWDKEVVENPDQNEPVKYKPLDKRYYFLRTEKKELPVTIASASTQQQVDSPHYYAESFWKLPFYDSINSYYTPLRQILDSAVVIDAELYLSENDIASLDFKKLYYIEQLMAYCIINKVSNYVPGKPVKCELVRVQYQTIAEEQPLVKITKVVVNNYRVHVYFNVLVPLQDVIFEYETGNNTWSAITIPAAPQQYSYDLYPQGQRSVRIKAGESYSNIVQISIPSQQTIVIS